MSNFIAKQILGIRPEKRWSLQAINRRPKHYKLLMPFRLKLNTIL
jgi:hypothetical protein